MARWTNETLYDSLVKLYGDKWRVPVALIKAVIAAESGFNSLASRKEPPKASLPPTPDFPAGGDESRGLMQLLVRTARALGFTGDPIGLYNAATNIDLGTRLLADNLRRSGGNLDAAISAYNGGFSSVQPNDGKRTGDAGTPFINQAYVDRVKSYIKYFQSAAGSSTPAPKVPTGTEPVGGLVAIERDTNAARSRNVLITVAMVAAVVWFATQQGKKVRR